MQRVIRLRGPGGTYSGMTSWPVLILLYKSLSFVPLKGNCPQKKANISTPDAYISVGGPQNSVFLTISGAMYEGVPQKILIFCSLGMQVEKPKSISLTYLFSLSITFSSLMSLCAIHLACRYESALSNWRQIPLASSSVILRLGLLLRKPCVEPPETYSSTSIT